MIKRKQIIFRAMNDVTHKNQKSGDDNNIENNKKIKDIECSCSPPSSTIQTKKKTKTNCTEDGHADVMFDPFGIF